MHRDVIEESLSVLGSQEIQEKTSSIKKLDAWMRELVEKAEFEIK